MIIEIYKKDWVGKNWTMVGEVYSIKSLIQFYQENRDWKLKIKITKIDRWDY